MNTRVLKIFTNEDIKKISEVVKAWRTGENYKDVNGFCKSVSFDELEKNNFTLLPGRYVGIKDKSLDDESFDEKILRL